MTRILQDYNEVSIGNIAMGAVDEVFKNEVKRVMENIRDENTSPTEKREITIKFSFKPNKTREHADVSFKCNSKIAGLDPIGSTVYFGHNDQGQLSAFQNNIRQPMLNFEQPKEQPTND